MKIQTYVLSNFASVLLFFIPLTENRGPSNPDLNVAPAQPVNPWLKQSVFEKESWQNCVSNYLKKQFFLKNSHLTAFVYHKTDHPQILFSRKKHTTDLRKQLGLNHEPPEVIKNKQSLKQLLSDFEPSTLQLKILSHLYHSKSATQLDLYPILTDSLSIPFEEFNHCLNELAEKGFLIKKKISPQHIFTFFFIPVEISQKNRKNPVYLYELNVDEAQIKSYLQMRQIDSHERKYP